MKPKDKNFVRFCEEAMDNVYLMSAFEPQKMDEFIILGGPTGAIIGSANLSSLYMGMMLEEGEEEDGSRDSYGRIRDLGIQEAASGLHKNEAVHYAGIVVMATAAKVEGKGSDLSLEALDLIREQIGGSTDGYVSQKDKLEESDEISVVLTMFSKGDDDYHIGELKAKTNREDRTFTTKGADPSWELSPGEYAYDATGASSAFNVLFKNGPLE